MVAVKNLVKSFNKVDVLKNVNLQFEESGITAILGPNGSGKTTLMKCILGMAIPNKGDVLVNGVRVNGNWDYRKHIDYLPQIARFPENLKVYELFNLLKDLRKVETRDEELIKYFEIEGFLNKKLGQLSGGMMQKVNIIQSLMFDSDVVILDEPTVGLDPLALQRFKHLVMEEKKKGKLVLITTHILNFVEQMADHVVYLLDGEIYFQGELTELKAKFGGESLEQSIAAIMEGENQKQTAEH